MRPTAMLVVHAALAASMVATPASAHAQIVAASASRDVVRADSLVRSGRVARAEALYYAAVRARPRDPAARFALGRYLASRGAWRVGAVLIEEARRFGGDPVRAAALLAPLYDALADHEALLALEHVEIGGDATARARWLRANPPGVAGADSVRVPLRRVQGAGELGAVDVIVGTDTVRAVIDPSADGLVLDEGQRRAPGIRAFGAALGVVDRVAVGALVLRNTPVGFASLGGARRARIGTDVLQLYAPTIDLTSAVLTLRRSGRVTRGTVPPGGSRVALLESLPGADGEPIPGPWLAAGTGVARFAPATVVRLAPGRLTIDPRRGEILIEP